VCTAISDHNDTLPKVEDKDHNDTLPKVEDKDHNDTLPKVEDKDEYKDRNKKDKVGYV
jgi:hypothetical protein